MTSTLNSGGLIDLEVKKILNSPNPITNNYEYEIVVHTEKHNIYIKMLRSVEWLKDYNSNVSDFIVISFDIMGGEYIKKIYPNKDNLEATITKLHKYNAVPPVSKRYKMVMINNVDGVEGSMYTKMSETDLNQTFKFTCEAQLILREFEGLRAVSVGGVYRDTDVNSVISTAFNALLSSKLTVHGKKAEVLLSKEAPQNDFVYNQIIVPSGTTLLDLPSWLQHKPGYGVYNGNIGTYFDLYNDKPTVFIYPLYKITPPTKGPELIIFHSNTSRYEFVENTYTKDGDILKIMCGNKIQNIDQGSNSLINVGSAYIAQDPNVVMNRSFEVNDEKVQMNKNDRLEGVYITKRRDNVEKTLYVGNGENNYVVRSDMLKGTLSHYQIPWNFCNFDLLIPGMGTTFVYEDERYGISKLYGTLQSGFAKYNHINGTTTGLLNIMVQNPNVYLAKEREES